MNRRIENDRARELGIAKLFQPQGHTAFAPGNDATVAGAADSPGDERVKAEKRLMANETVRSVKSKLRRVREDTS